MTIDYFKRDNFEYVAVKQRKSPMINIGMVTLPDVKYSEGTDIHELISDTALSTNFQQAYFTIGNNNTDRLAHFSPQSQFILQCTTCIQLLGETGKAEDEAAGVRGYLDEIDELLSVLLNLKEAPVAICIQSPRWFCPLYQCLARPAVPDNAKYAEYINDMLRAVLPKMGYNSNRPFAFYDWGESEF